MKRRNFTLIEILIVVAVVVLLAGMLLGAIGAVMRQAAERDTRQRIVLLQTAITAYTTEYQHPPVSGSVDRRLSQAEYDTMIKHLVSIPPDHHNPRKINFLRIDNPLHPDYFDAWERPLRVALDLDYDGTVSGATLDGGGNAASSIAIWSAGVDGFFGDEAHAPTDAADDNLRSWAR